MRFKTKYLKIKTVKNNKIMNRTIKLSALIALCCGVVLLTGCSEEEKEQSYGELSGNYFVGTWHSSWIIEVPTEVEVEVDEEDDMDGETKTEIIIEQIHYYSTHTFKADKTWQSTLTVDEEVETFEGTYNFSEKNKTLTLIAVIPDEDKSTTTTNIYRYIFESDNSLRITDMLAASHLYTKQ